MTGLEKVIARIIADAEADAKRILAEADAECDAIRTQYDAATKAERDRLRERADRECEALITRAKSSAAMAKRNAVLEARARLVDEAYATAEKEIRTLTEEKYLDLLLTMLRGSLRRQLDGEREIREVYGEEVTPLQYEVILNRTDRERYGKRLLDMLGRSAVGKLRSEDVARVVLATDTAAIEGGLILRCGSVESNCSFEVLFAEVRRATEIKVSHVLFPKEA